MSSTELAVISPRTFDEAVTLAKHLAPSVAVPAELRGKPADVMAIVMRGAELGLPPMTALASMHAIKGRVTLSADGMSALVQRNREVCQWLRLVESTGDAATYETQRAGHPSPVRLSFTRAQAKAAGLGGDNWSRYPDAMLRARCLSAICRAVYPDLVLGLYDPDELGGADAPAVPVVTVPPPAHVVEGEVVTSAPASPPKAQPVAAAEAPKARRLVIQESGDDVAAIRACSTMADLDALRKAKASGWDVPTRAEWGIKAEALRKEGA